jgi:hypothetical protein
MWTFLLAKYRFKIIICINFYAFCEELLRLDGELAKVKVRLDLMRLSRG